jgi:hypothetical protein
MSFSCIVVAICCKAMVVLEQLWNFFFINNNISRIGLGDRSATILRGLAICKGSMT